MSKGKQVCWTRSPSGCRWDYFCQAPQAASVLSGWLLPVWQVALVWIIQAFPQGSLPCLAPLEFVFAVHRELGPAWHANLISLILLWVWLFCPAAPYINSNRRAARELMIPSPHLFLITVAEFSMSKQLWTVSASSPFPHVLEGPPCPPVAELCWEEEAFFFPLEMRQGKPKQCLSSGLGAVPVCFGGISVFLGGFASCSSRA